MDKVNVTRRAKQANRLTRRFLLVLLFDGHFSTALTQLRNISTALYGEMEQ